MEHLTITQVAARYDVTPRMLRHYEKLGLLTPCRREDYAYRTYDEEALRRLQQIILLRKLRLPCRISPLFSPMRVRPEHGDRAAAHSDHE